MLMRCHNIRGDTNEYCTSIFFAQSMTDEEFQEIVDWCKKYANLRKDDIGRRSVFFRKEEDASKFIVEWGWR